MAHSPEYLAYLESAEWHQRRQTFIDRVGHCERCGREAMWYEVHHRHYRTLGHETPGDVQVLCTDCHEIMDACRRAGFEWPAA